MHTFNAGDVVECVDNSNCSVLTTGKIYTVVGGLSGSNWVRVMNDTGIFADYYLKRFIPYIPPQQSDPGDETPHYTHYAQSSVRKATPIASGVLDYFPLAIAAIARLSKYGNDKHNPGEPLHWSRGKSNDHRDCIARHLIDCGTVDGESGELHDVALAWRALANLQIAEETRLTKMQLAEEKRLTAAATIK